MQELQQGYEEASQHLEVLREIAPTLDQIMTDRWSAIDWDTLAREDPSAYWAYKAQYDREVAATVAAQEAQEAASRRERAQAIQRERGRLLQLAPEFGQPEKARGAIAAMKAFAQAIGMDAAVLRDLNGAETYALHLAAQAWSAQRGLSAKKVAAATPKVTPPGAAPSSKSQSARVAEAEQRLNQTGSIDAALELLRAKKGR
ncbi:MAG: hypothetical protein HC927_07060 [Deltaproteobacteria bacterium]|nr:hypothetical protein [Deltaproteobacteria bacterium]